MNHFLKLAQKRQSVRKYKSTPVEPEKITSCIEAARLAPSACNAQPWKFIVVDDPNIKNSLADKTADRILPLNHFTKQAPVHIVIVRESANISSQFGSAVKQKQFPFMDVAIAAEHICLQAADEGLGTCMMGWFNEGAVKKLLQIPKNKRIPLIITLGYPDTELKEEKQRKPFDQIISYNSYK